MEKQLKGIIEQLKYQNIIWVKDGIFIKFQIRNNKNRVVATLRNYVEDNFNPKSEFYRTAKEIVERLKSDYNYVVSYRLDCQ